MVAENSRWQKALARGNREGLVIMQRNPGMYLVSSSTNPNHFYEVNVQGSVASCDCQVQDGVCKHRALVLDLLGMLHMQEEVQFQPLNLPEITEEEIRNLQRQFGVG